jgi:hypothetical protein
MALLIPHGYGNGTIIPGTEINGKNTTKPDGKLKPVSTTAIRGAREMQVATQIEPTVSWDVMQASEPWKRLTPQQRIWFVHFIASDDSVAATRIAYPTATDKSVKCMSYEMLKRPAIIAALDFYNGKSDLEIDLDEIQKQIDAADPGSIAAQKLIALKASLKRGLKAASEEPETKSKATDESKSLVSQIGDIVLVDGKKHRVTAVDEHGKPTDGEPI